MPGVVCSPPTGTSAPADAAVPSSLGTADTSGEVTSWRTSPQGGIAPPSPDSESGIEDSPDSIDGVTMPLSPPIPIPSFRRGSLQLGRGHTPPPSALRQPDNLSNSAPATASEDNTPPSTRGTPSPPPLVSEEPQCGGEAGAGVPTIEISEDACPADQSLEESQVPPVPKGGESETSEQVSSHKPQPPKSSSPTKSPHHSTHNSSPQPNDGIPTDMSDTTETEPDSKVTCLSSECVVCPNLTTHHQGREIINTVFALPVDTVFTLLFTNSKFMLDLYTARKTTDVVASPWQSNHETNQKLRQVTYTLTLPPNSFGPKVSHVTETQVLSPFSKPGEIYTVDAEACNAGIPYADSFFVSNHWCLTRESATETRLSVWSQVKYKKNVWGFMKGVIDKNSFCGVESLLNDINAALLAEVDSANLKRTRRRRRRVGSKGEPPDVLIPSTADKVKDIHKSTQIPARKLTLPTVTTENNNSSNEGPVRLVVATLVILLTLNALLYYKLWALEEKVFVHTTPFPALDPSMFRPGTGSGALEEWVRILQQQEALHAAEVERWRKSIEEAAGFLRKAEESLRTLHTSIPPHHASKIQLLLRQLQNLHNSESQRRSSAESAQWGQEGIPGDPSKGPDVGDQKNSGEDRTVHTSENHQDL
ncbi:protein Aster-B-like [Penaeus chinensis]|uniref:protein Aster-B-like n=1 Tax=Penaeus chinensis TaxID=139456 RepID=UPI001FB7A6C3|nr:protein Aster-B-like [Penaeus chinensis]XP_047496272.1 protein Aster-B-like [Penaeus chinensis]XP_047496273.1 protein Aster-B-like [Penaeus chinensis]